MLTLASRKFMSLLLVAFLALAVPLNARADNPFFKPWTTVGSAGTVDEADLGKVRYDEGIARLHVNTPAQTVAVIRYNVVAVDGLADAGGDGYRLYLRYRDTGANDQVIVRLKSVEMATGLVTTLMTFNSNAFAPVPGFGTNSVVACSPNWGFNFTRYAYFVEATLIKSTTAGDPALTTVQISKTLC